MIAGAVFDYFKRSNVGFLEFLAVKDDVQSCGIGTKLYNFVLSVLLKDAERFSGKSLSFVFGEIDSPNYSKAKVKKYLYFWDKQNFKHIDMCYVQPALSNEQKSVDDLWLIVKSVDNTVLDKDTVILTLHDFLKYAESIDNPEENGEYQEMCKELNKKDVIKLFSIV